MIEKNKDLKCSMDIRIKSEDDRGGESGRSMVEMLGVLAVVGVLSVGGIAGYTYAMDKHYANELLMGASERAVLVTAQIVAGKTPNLNEFANHTVPNGTFGEVKTDIEDGFGITVSGVKDAVCENLLKETDGTNVYIANDDEDLTDVTCGGDNNAFMFVFDYGVSGGAGEETDPLCADVECEDGLMCFHGQCKCPSGVFMCGERCCAEGTYCAKEADSSTYTCVEPTGECTTNSDCGEDEYCKFTRGSCNGPTNGVCTDKGTLTSYTLNLPKGKLMVYKGGKMNWWSASNLCQAYDKQLVTMSDLGVSDNGQNYCYFDSAKRVNASKNETYQCNCTGDSGCTTTTTELYNKLGTSGYIWLADNGKSSSCDARYVYLNNGAVSNLVRYDDAFYALCR